MKTCCFTGHRPKKLNFNNIFILKQKLKNSIIVAINCGYENFISGMALGCDMLAADIVLELQKIYPIKLECAIPCVNQTEFWKEEDIKNYKRILRKANKITYTSNAKYYNGCMQKRNKYMVDNSSRIIAVFNGTPGGTMQTLKYAESKNLEIDIIQ